MKGVKSARTVRSLLKSRLIDFNYHFYTTFYPDLENRRVFVGAFLHYLVWGWREGRFGSYRAMLSAEEARFGPLPADFDPQRYLRLNPDLKQAFQDPWRPALHYLRHGAEERRRYAAFDGELYRQLYHPGADLTDVELIADAQRHPTRFHNWADLTEAYAMTPGPWLELFNATDVQMSAGRSAEDIPAPARAVERFLKEDIRQLTPIRTDLVFDVEYAREIDPESDADDVSLYRAWLRSGVGSGVAGSATMRLRQLGLPFATYPEAFDWRRQAQAGGRSQGDRWAVLAHLVETGPGPGGRIHVFDGADHFLLALANSWLRAGKTALAALALEDVSETSERALLLRIEVSLKGGEVGEAVSLSSRLEDRGVGGERLAPLARLFADSGEHKRALDLLGRARRRDHKWRAEALYVAQRVFDGKDQALRRVALGLLTPGPVRGLAHASAPVEFKDGADADRVISDLVGASALLDGGRGDALDRMRVRAAAEAMNTPPLGDAQIPSARPRVLLVNVYFPPDDIGGATITLMRNIIDWRASGALFKIDVAVVCVDEAASHGQIRLDTQLDIPVFRIGAAGASRADAAQDLLIAAAFRRVTEAFSPDLIHFHSIQTLSTSVVAASAGTPYLVTLHDGWWISDAPFFITPDGDLAEQRSLESWLPLLRAARTRMAVSPWIARTYERLGAGRVNVIENGVPHVSPRRQTTASDDRLRIGFVGGRWKLKGYGVLRAALHRENLSRLHLTVVDQNEPSDFEAFEVWGSTPVRIVGRIAPDDMNSLYADIDVLAAPSVAFESYGLAVREALQAGLWAIVSDRGALADVIREGENGFIVGVDSTRDLQRTLKRLDVDSSRFKIPPRWRPNIPSCSLQAKLIFEQYLEALAEL